MCSDTGKALSGCPEPQGTPAREGFDYNNSRVITEAENKQEEQQRKESKTAGTPPSKPKKGIVQAVPRPVGSRQPFPLLRSSQAEARATAGSRPDARGSPTKGAAPCAEADAKNAASVEDVGDADTFDRSVERTTGATNGRPHETPTASSGRDSATISRERGGSGAHGQALGDFSSGSTNGEYGDASKKNGPSWFR